MSVAMQGRVNFYNPNTMVSKPANLQNSAVLRMLEEEEARQRNGQPPSAKRVTWPPPREGGEEGEQEETQAAPYYPQNNYREPPPSTIQLKPEVPVSQAPAPVYTSQPATATLRGRVSVSGKNMRGDLKWPPAKEEINNEPRFELINLEGGKNMRGDLKWPPQNVKEQMDAENQARIELAKGPVCRPRKVRKDYSSFFAQHALNSTYPGYKAPPGTQFYEQMM